jgi:hypothetical protein
MMATNSLVKLNITYDRSKKRKEKFPLYAGSVNETIARSIHDEALIAFHVSLSVYREGEISRGAPSRRGERTLIFSPDFRFILSRTHHGRAVSQDRHHARIRA